MENGIYGATEDARRKIKNGYNPFNKKKEGCGCGDKKICTVGRKEEKAVEHSIQSENTTD